MTEVFIESIKVKDGEFYNLPYHIDRMRRTAWEVLKTDLYCNEELFQVPENRREGLVKCRLLYSRTILSVEFIPYRFKELTALSLVTDDGIEYGYKSENRTAFERLLEGVPTGEILIVKNGFVTDTSISNVVFADQSGYYTPDTYLLPGTKRSFLLEHGIIEERPIRYTDIEKFDTLYLINAMIDLEDEIKIPVESLTPIYM